MLYALLNLGLVLSVFMVTCGVYNVGFSYAFGTMVSLRVASKEQKCVFDLTILYIYIYICSHLILPVQSVGRVLGRRMLQVPDL